MAQHLYVIGVGYDRESIQKTVFQAGCQKVCLLSTEKKQDGFRSKADERTQEVEQELKDAFAQFADVDVLRSNWSDYEDMLTTISAYLEDHKDWGVTLNITFGSNRLTPILLMLASLHGHRIEYTRCEELRDDLLEGDWHTGFAGVEPVPALPLDIGLSKKERRFLALVKEKQSLIVQDYINKYSGEENKLRSEFNYYAAKLREKGFVAVEENAKRNIVTLTQAGQLLLAVQW